MMTEPPEVDLNEVLKVATEVARLAGDLIRSLSFGQLEIHQKNQAHDVVTNLDLASEKLIMAGIRARFPGHQLFSEERGVVGGDAHWTWVIDPLDGTNNLAIGVPAYAVGIAVCRDGVPVVSVIHDPLSERTWSAIKGQGFDGEMRADFNPARASRSVIAWTQGYGVETDDMTACAYRLILERQSTRLLQLWAPLPCWVMLARGDIDAFVGYRVGKTDLFAGSLLASESGLVVRHIDGGPFVNSLGNAGAEDHEDQNFVAGRRLVVDRLLIEMAAVARIRKGLSAVWATAAVAGAADATSGRSPCR